MEKVIRNSLTNWKYAAKNTFIPVAHNIFLLKVRDTLLPIECFNKVVAVKGLTFIDVMTEDGYFLGEFIIVDEEAWGINAALRSITLTPNYNYTVKKVSKLRDDGFIKTYKTTNSRIVVCCI